MGQPGAKRLFCNRCKSETNHVARGSHKRSYYEDDSSYWEEDIFTLLTCAGCDKGTLEEAWTQSGYLRPAGPTNEDTEQDYSLAYAPPRGTQTREPKVFRQLPKALSAIYKECVAAYNNDLHLLCGAGLRALIEGICEDKKVKGTNLQKKIDALAGVHLPQNITKSLHSFRFIGNDAVHKLDVPLRRDLDLAIEVAEDLLNFFYELDYKASRLPQKKIATTPTPQANTKAPGTP
jgi:hypothetical protein